VPAGQYTQQFLDQAALDPAFGAAFREGLLANVASYEDNVKAVLAKVVLGEADAGIVYMSDISSENAGQIGQIAISAELNVSAYYPIAVLSDSAQPELAQAFIDYIMSEAGQEILAANGFLPPDPEQK
jgi:molybdate transport system substrate-binding protein